MPEQPDNVVIVQPSDKEALDAWIAAGEDKSKQKDAIAKYPVLKAMFPGYAPYL